MNRTVAVTIAASLLSLSGCVVGPNYKTPAAITAPAFKEAPPASFAESDGWKTGQPSDTRLKGDWWSMFQDPQLSELEAQVDGANQTLKAAAAKLSGVAVADIRTQSGHVILPGGTKIPYVDLSAEAAKIPPVLMSGGRTWIISLRPS